MKNLIFSTAAIALLTTFIISCSQDEETFVPGAPTIGTTIAGDGQASIPFTAPANNGGATIIIYTATSSPGGINGTLSQAGSGTIIVTGLTNGTAYTFTVTATNSVGTSAASAASNSVTPATVPGSPTVGTATAGNAQASIPFTAPAANGGSPIIKYTATSSPGGITGTLSQAGSGSIIVTGLTNGTAYTFTVTATNNAGTSLASAASNSVTPVTVPGSPTVGTATAGNAQASVPFTAPANNGGATIILYTATSSPGGITGTLSQAGSGTIIVTGLTNGTAYTFTVTATNSVGTSAASAASNSVTPVTPPLAPGDVLSTTGKVWMDRNLGATQVAISSTDAAAYGDIYQWGRGTDGHQIRTSATTTTLSSSDTPGHGSFILAPISPLDWRSPQNTNLWQGVNGINNPCPSGYRLPTETELNAERASWSSQNAAGAFASPLKLPVAGDRSGSNGSLVNVGTSGGYWSSTVSSTNSRGLAFGSSDAAMYASDRAVGASVRCIKD